MNGIGDFRIKGKDTPDQREADIVLSLGKLLRSGVAFDLDLDRGLFLKVKKTGQVAQMYLKKNSLKIQRKKVWKQEDKQGDERRVEKQENKQGSAADGRCTFES